jgi:hypothetical protein
MKKSRLNLFKSTSMAISIIGVIMIIVTIIVAAYIGFSLVSSNLSGGISSGNQYDELASLKANYSDLEGQFNTTKIAVYASNNDSLQQQFADAQLELVRAQNSLDAVDSALSTGKPSSEVDTRLKQAREDLQSAHEAYNNLPQGYV